MNEFLNKNLFNDARTENMGTAQSTSGDELVDQFAKSASHRGRDINTVFKEQEALDRDYGKWALIFVLYLRLISRVVKFWDGSRTEKTQKGQGNKDESYKRFLWYAQHKPKLFYLNLPLFLMVGSDKDLYSLMWMARKNNIKVNEDWMIHIVFNTDREDKGLLKKYMPLQKSKKKLRTEYSKFRNEIARKIRVHQKFSVVQARRYKSNSTAHVWQQLISARLFKFINFSSIPGRALSLLVGGKFLRNQKLESKYQEWLSQQPVVKYTGYVHELGDKINKVTTGYQKITIDKQFEGLLNLSKETGLSNRRVICAVDRSGSMVQKVAGGSTLAINVAESLGVYFANLLKGYFHKYVIVFSREARLFKLPNAGFCEQKQSMRWGDCPENTDFQKVIDLIVNTRASHPEIPIEDYPDTLLIVSDMQFDKANKWSSTPVNQDPETAYQMAVEKLKRVFPLSYARNFAFIWWDCTGRVYNFPTKTFEPGSYLVSGFDGAILDFLLGAIERKESVEQSIQDILSQEVFKKVLYES